MTEAFENWYLREIAPFEPALRSRLRALVYSDSDVEDLLWSAYERLIETGIWRSAHRPVALVHQIARNLALDQLRRSRIVPIESASAAFFQAADDEPGPEERLDDRHALAVVIAAIEALPEQCQRVFKLRRLDGMSPAEISAHTGLSISTIEKHVAKGLRLCADRLAQIGLERKKSQAMGEANRNREAVMAEAADWLARLDASDRDASLKEAFESWRAESPSHAVALARLKGAWELSGQLQPAAARPKPTNTPMQMKPGWLISAAAAAGAIILVVATADPTVSYATQVGERRVIELGQGQSLTLNTDSRVEVRRRRSGALVRLTRGEVLVTSRSGAPPIHLSAGSLNLQTSGSTFDMRLTPQGARVAVVVGTVPLPGQSGRSEAANAGDVADIQAGEVVGSVRPMPAEVQRTVAWRTGRLEFDGQTLGEVVAEFNRYNRTKLSVAPEVAALRIGGGYDIDSPDAFAASTARAFDLKLRHQDDTLEISR